MNQYDFENDLKVAAYNGGLSPTHPFIGFNGGYDPAHPWEATLHASNGTSVSSGPSSTRDGALLGLAYELRSWLASRIGKLTEQLEAARTAFSKLEMRIADWEREHGKVDGPKIVGTDATPYRG